MRSKLHNDYRSHFIFILFTVVTGSLYLSRAVLSVAIILLLLTCLLQPAVKQLWKTFISTPLLWGMSLLFLLPLLSGAWSENKEEWMAMMQIKLPLLLLPLAFASPFQLTKKQWERVAYVFIGSAVAGSVWSMFQYLPQTEAVHQGYLQSKSIITPLENDHVRFSWLVSMAILTAGWMGIRKKNQERTVALLLGFAAAWLIVFLHILAARTGLLSFYIMLLVVAVWLVARNIHKRNGWLLLVMVVALPLIAYFSLPTFQNKIRYIRYDFSYFKQAQYLPGANDAVRVISIKAGWKVTTDNLLTGVGFGDVYSETKKQYAMTYPQMEEADKIYPSGEWLMYSAGAGIAGLIIFLLAMVVPFVTRVNNKLPWYLLNITVAFGFLFDIGLEVQYGVTIYAFVVLAWWKWQQQALSHKNM